MIQRKIYTSLIIISLVAILTPQVAAVGSHRTSCGLATGSYPVISYPHLAGLATCIKQVTFTPVFGVHINWGFGFPNFSITKMTFPITHTGDYPGFGFVDSLQLTTNSTGQASIYARNEGALSGPSQVLMCSEPERSAFIICVFFQ